VRYCYYNYSFSHLNGWYFLPVSLIDCGPVDLKQQLIGTSRSRTHLSRMLQVDGSPGSSSAESDTETTKLSKPCNTTTTNTTTTSDFGLFDCETDDDWIDFRKSAVKSIGRD